MLEIISTLESALETAFCALPMVSSDDNIPDRILPTKTELIEIRKHFISVGAGSFCGFAVLTGIFLSISHINGIPMQYSGISVTRKRVEVEPRKLFCDNPTDCMIIIHIDDKTVDTI